MSLEQLLVSSRDLLTAAMRKDSPGAGGGGGGGGVAGGGGAGLSKARRVSLAMQLVGILFGNRRAGAAVRQSLELRARSLPDDCVWVEAGAPGAGGDGCDGESEMEGGKGVRSGEGVPVGGAGNGSNGRGVRARSI